MVGNNNSHNQYYLPDILNLILEKMKKNTPIIRLFYLLLAFSIASGQSIIANNTQDDLPIYSGQLEQSFLTPNKFNMNQGFTLMTSMSSGTSQTIGIYSNFSNFKLSERLQFNTGFHLFQGQNNFSYSNAPQTGIGYELGLEYKLSPNSIITIQMVNYNNAPIHYGNRPLLNAH